MVVLRFRRGKVPAPGMALVPLAAVLFGIAAVLIAGVVPPAPQGSASRSAGPSKANGVTYQEAGLAVGIVMVLGIAYLVAARVYRGRAGFPEAAIAASAGIFIAALLALALLHLAAAPAAQGAAQLNPVGGSHNGTGGVPGSLSNTSLNQTPDNQTPIAGVQPGWPVWTPYVVLALAAGLVGALALGLGRGPAGGRRVLGPPSGAPGVNASGALHDALSELERGAGSDPRAIIVALYRRLLEQVGDRAAPVEPSTPREIEQGLVVRLRVGVEAAHELTLLFEEARYSSRPLGPAEAARARAALAKALDDLARPRGTMSAP